MAKALVDLPSDFAVATAKAAGAKGAVAKMAYIAASVGDFAGSSIGQSLGVDIPEGVPVGSLTVIALSTVKNPLASYRVARDYVRGIIYNEEEQDDGQGD